MSRLDAALFVGDQPIPRTVKLADGSEHTFYFRPLLASRFRQYHEALASDDPKVSDMAQAKLLADGMCMEDGGEALTAEEAYRLKPLVQVRLREALLIANELTPAAKNG